ncbi:hypothetical protein B0H10DRAFT_2051359 [Mycena sp. CBHHK59/15]|nr:hypothetical protein B0H10DRAFT_2051359 [Mycena sp. CBHHK59/15]
MSFSYSSRVDQGKPNTYKVCTLSFIRSRMLPEFVTFTTTTPFQLPRADLLAVHAAACRVAHLSGAAEHLEKQYEEDEEPVPPVWAMTELEFADRLAQRLRKEASVSSFLDLV